MSIPANSSNNEKTGDVLLKSHPERFWLLGGAWLAITLSGIMGGIAIVNPQKKIPIIDPLIQVFSQEKDSPQGAKFQEIDTVWDSTHPSDLAVSFWVKEVEKQKTLEETTSEVPQEISPSSRQSSEIPAWIYLAIAGSCVAGSSLITWSLYKATCSLRRQKARRKVAKKGQVLRRPNVNASAAVPAPVRPRPVDAIAPLQISTPKNVELPSVKLEPVVEPQSSERRQLSRAEQLALLAKQAKQQKEKSFIDSVDIRHRNRWASFS